MWELWGALLNGGRLVVVPHWTTRSPSALAELIVDEHVTVLNATPSLFLTALDDLVTAADDLSLRVVVFGGEALQPSALRAVVRPFRGGRAEAREHVRDHRDDRSRHLPPVDSRATPPAT